MSDTNTATVTTITLEPAWYRCEYGCEFRAAFGDKPPNCHMALHRAWGAKVEIVPEVADELKPKGAEGLTL